jgi:hypothetical protein
MAAGAVSGVGRRWLLLHWQACAVAWVALRCAGWSEAVCLVLWDPELCHDGNLTLFPQVSTYSLEHPSVSCLGIP